MNPRNFGPFVFRQAIKTAHRPARLFTIAGHLLFQHDRTAAAWECLKISLALGKPSFDEYLLGAMCLYHGRGRFHEAMALLTRSNERSTREAESLGLGDICWRVLDPVWAHHIGHTAMLDYVIKLGILEGRRPEDTILYLPRGSAVANRFLLRQMTEHLRVIEDPAELPFDASTTRALHFDLLGPRLPDRTTAYIWELAGKTYKRWHQEGRGPLLQLPPEVEARGRSALRDAGLPHDAWFVALHVREGRWDGRHAGLHGILNADISTYLPAIDEITRDGGWVVRMGDPGMGPMPQVPNLIDYCHSNLRADWMDVFIAARCRFMLGTSSGPAYIPALYGVPSVLTNWWPPAQRPWHASDIFVPKLLRRSADARYLTLSETLHEPFSYCHSRRYLADHCGVHVEDNDAETIRAAVEEMLTRLDGNEGEDAEAELRTRADQVYESHHAIGMAQLARDFLRRHSSLIV
jgi:putative glycosyltransferase (TIGR04372 family)